MSLIITGRWLKSMSGCSQPLVELNGLCQRQPWSKVLKIKIRNLDIWAVLSGVLGRFFRINIRNIRHVHHPRAEKQLIVNIVLTSYYRSKRFTNKN